MRIKQDGPRVILADEQGRLIGNLSAVEALDLAKAIRVQALAAQEIAEAERIVQEHALLLRIGAPFGLSDHPDIQAEAAKEAAWNSDLRRYLPGGVKATTDLGVPRVVRHKRRKTSVREDDGR